MPTDIIAVAATPGFPGTLLASLNLAQLLNTGQQQQDLRLDQIFASDPGNVQVQPDGLITFTLSGGRLGYMRLDLSDPFTTSVTDMAVSGNTLTVGFNGRITFDDFSGAQVGPALFTLAYFHSATLRFTARGNWSVDQSGAMSGTVHDLSYGTAAYNVHILGAFQITAGNQLAGTVTNFTFDDATLNNSFNWDCGFLNNAITLADLQSRLNNVSDVQSFLNQFDYSGNDDLALDFAYGAVFNSGSGNDWLGGGRGNDSLHGGSGNDTVSGGSGDDTLEGGPGFDALRGRDGNDTYLVPDESDSVEEMASEGTSDTLVVWASTTLNVPNIENLTLFEGSGATTGTGNESANRLIGNPLANSLDGAGGADTLIGGVGVDTTAGGSGDDLHVVADPEDVTEESPGGGTDTVQSAIDWILQSDTENLVLLPGALSGTGNELPNLITGNAGNNTLNGAGGADTLLGGLGNDTYVLGPGDVWTDTGGIDTVVSSGSFFTLPSNLEHVTLSAGAGNGWVVGSAIGNHFVGNVGTNLLQGGDGADTLEGGRGDDTLLGGAGNDRLSGGRGSDVMEGGAGNDTYVASGVRDQIIELAGGGIDSVEVDAARFTLANEVENVLVTRTGGAIVTGNALVNSFNGGAGNDTFTGGGGADRFVFDDLGNVDQIVDFVAGIDKIQLENAVFTGPLVFGVNIEYDAPTGALLYNDVQFATLGSGTAHPTFAAGDLQII